MKLILIKIIQMVLWIIDEEHRSHECISTHNDKKFTHIQDANFQSDYGNVDKVFRTVPYQLWKIKTVNHELVCADRHRVVRDDGSYVWVESLSKGDKIQTNSGIEEIVFIKNLNIRTHTYCVSVNSDSKDKKHLYQTNGIISHNTTCAAGYILWRAMFVPDSGILIAANKMSQAGEIMTRIRFAYENMEDNNWIRAGATEYNKGSITFDNGSKITARATTPDAGRGLSISLLYLDEFAFVKPNMAAEFWTAISPTLSTGGSCIITSTPNNDEDQFAQIWKGSIVDTDDQGHKLPDGVGINGFFPIEVPWFEHPDRDDQWEKDYRAKIGNAKFDREFLCKFVSGDDTLINPLVLSRLVPTPEEFIIDDSRWFKEPQPNHVYGLAWDPAMGSVQDFASIQVVDFTTMEQVAEWRSNRVSISDQTKMLIKMLYFIYQTLGADPEQDDEPEIYWTMENNGLGLAADSEINHLGEDAFPGVLVNEPKRGAGYRVKGLRTSKNTKMAACSFFKRLIESDKLKVYSRPLLREMKNFVRSGGSYAAKSGEHDDLIMSMIITIRLLMVIQDWSDNINDELNDDLLDDLTIEPMPFIT